MIKSILKLCAMIFFIAGIIITSCAFAKDDVCTCIPSSIAGNWSYTDTSTGAKYQMDLSNACYETTKGTYSRITITMPDRLLTLVGGMVYDKETGKAELTFPDSPIGISKAEIKVTKRNNVSLKLISDSNDPESIFPEVKMEKVGNAKNIKRHAEDNENSEDNDNIMYAKLNKE